MRASILTTGLDISLVKEDKSKEKLECIANGFKNIKVFLHVVDDVKENRSREERGFHMQCLPDDVELRKSSEAHVYITKEIWNDLITKYDHEAGGGHFESRCRYDRCSIRYWDEKMSPSLHI